MQQNREIYNTLGAHLTHEDPKLQTRGRHQTLGLILNREVSDFCTKVRLIFELFFKISKYLKFCVWPLGQFSIPFNNLAVRKWFHFRDGTFVYFFLGKYFLSSMICVVIAKAQYTEIIYEIYQNEVCQGCQKKLFLHSKFAFPTVKEKG